MLFVGKNIRISLIFRSVIFATLLWSSLLGASASSQLSDAIKIPGARSVYDISYDYYTKLLELALTKGSQSKDAGLEFIDMGRMAEGRALRELIKGENLDVFWFGTDKYKERELNAVKIPLERGLMGFRKFIIHRDSISLFDQIDSLDELRKFVACQGTHWPDTRILQDAGLMVLSSPIYENMFMQVNRKRCDYFPRGYHEGRAELEQRNGLYPDLVRYEDIILHYPLSVYFFTSRNNLQLAQRIESGLTKAIDDGSFLRHMQSHPMTKHIFPVEDWMQVRRYFHLHNTEMSEATDVKDEKLWFQPAEAHIPEHDPG